VSLALVGAAIWQVSNHTPLSNDTGAAAAAAPDCGPQAAPSLDDRPSPAESTAPAEPADAQARSPHGPRQQTESILALADYDAREALRLTEAIADDMERRALRLAIVKRWAAQDADGAIAWAEAHPDGEWQPALAAAFAGAAAQPSIAIAVAERLIARSPERVGDYGQHLIAGLAEAAAFTEAAGFAATAPADVRAAWLHDAFFHWAAHDPTAAVRACEQLSAGDTRLLAVKGLVAGWAQRDPAAVANYALQLETGGQRLDALNQALPQWVARDPAGAATWLVRQDLIAEFDAGSSALATLPELVQRQPATAVKWAASIAEPTLRANTLRGVATEWARRDAGELAIFIASAFELPESDRETLREGLKPAPDA
ncbi:MAG TPA: hypothetical protein VM029_07390, partial [Opitutaceae bacterium]|nr:hypothetical protein [Opitutaceae bacterium]